VEKKIKQELLTTKVRGLFPTWRMEGARLCPSFGARSPAFFWAFCPAAERSFLPSFPMRWRSGVSRPPQEFGKGAIEGVAGPESANNSAAQGAFIPS